MTRACVMGLAAAALLWAGCSSSNTGGSRCEGTDCIKGDVPLPGGDGDMSTDQSGGGFGGDFGNSQEPVMAAPVDMGDGDGGDDGVSSNPGDCEVGVFCADRQPDSDKCGSLRLESDVEVTIEPGNLLILFDQSGSMEDNWPGTASTKMAAARSALEAAISSLQDNVTVGALMFPSYACVPFLPPPPGGAVAPISDPNQIGFQPGSQFLSSWNAYWTTGAGSLNIGLGTPLNEAFDRADVALQNATLSGQVAVVVFTDGEPTCFPALDANGAQIAGIPTMPEPQRAADWLANQGVKTYVVGLPGANGVQVLNNVAQSGGTMQYIVPDDPAALEAKLREVVEETIKSGFDSCSISLNPAAEVPDELLMIVEEPMVGTQQVPRDRGWSLSATGDQVEITGGLCDDAMSGRFSSITFEYACPEDPPPPVLPPVR